MTRAQEALLLTMARILRAKIKNDIYAAQEDDLWAMNEALAPFDPSPAQEKILAGFKSSK